MKKKIKVFQTSNRKMLITQNQINEWIEEENIEIHQIEISTGAMYNSKSSTFNFDEVEMFITVLYSK